MEKRLYGLLILLALFAAAPAAQAGKEELLSVQVREVKLREKPSFVSKPGDKVQYATRVTVLERKDAWVKVKDNDGHSGWIHSSALTEKIIKLKSKNKGGLSLSGRSEKKGELEEKEIALAGKGLAASSDVNSGKLSYDWVDKMEKIVIPEEEIQAFLEKQQGKKE